MGEKGVGYLLGQKGYVEQRSARLEGSVGSETEFFLSREDRERGVTLLSIHNDGWLDVVVGAWVNDALSAGGRRFFEIGEMVQGRRADGLNIKGGGIHGFRVHFKETAGVVAGQRGSTRIAYALGAEEHRTQVVDLDEPDSMHSTDEGSDMTLRIDEKHRVTRSELHALLRGRPLIWNGKSTTGGSMFAAKLTLELGSDVTMGERTAALDALVNDVTTTYRGGFAVNPRGEAFPVAGSTAWLAYVATNADRIVWRGKPLAEHTPDEQRVAVEAWLRNEQVPPIVAATGAYMTEVEGEPRRYMVPLYGKGDAATFAVPDASTVMGAVDAMDDALKLNTEAEGDAPIDPDKGASVTLGAAVTKAGRHLAPPAAASLVGTRGEDVFGRRTTIEPRHRSSTPEVEKIPEDEIDVSLIAAKPDRTPLDGNGDPIGRRPMSKDLPRQPGDEKPVNEEDPDGPQWGEVFGRPRIAEPAALPPGYRRMPDGSIVME